MIGIYMIKNKHNNKVYIGQSKDIENRWIQHKSRLRCNTHENKHLQNSYNTYGEDIFEYTVIEECGLPDLDIRETYYINYYDSYNTGYNQDLGGGGCKGYKHTDEEILKMRHIQNPKAVLQLDLDLNIINEWISCSHAGKTLNISIRGIKACCNRINRQKTINGFYWIYKEEYENNTVDWDYYLNINASKPKRVSQYDFNMNLIKIWDSAYQAQTHGGFDAASISSVCNCKPGKNTYKGFVWRFTDNYTEDEYKKDCNTNFAKRPGNGAKPILQYDLNGNIVSEYESLCEAIRQTGFSKSSLSDCLHGKTKKSHNYIWKYKS